MAQAPGDCYEYVRKTYGVPAYVGVRVRAGEREGVIVSARSDLHYVHVRFDGQKFAVNAHPSDVEYLDVAAVAANR
jgi:hypothetical protein